MSLRSYIPSLCMPIPSPTVHSAAGLDLPAFPPKKDKAILRLRSKFNLTVNTIQYYSRKAGSDNAN